MKTGVAKPRAYPLRAAEGTVAGSPRVATPLGPVMIVYARASTSESVLRPHWANTYPIVRCHRCARMPLMLFLSPSAAAQRMPRSRQARFGGAQL